MPGPAGRRIPRDGHLGGHRHRGQVPQAGRAAAGPLREDERLLRGLAGRGAALRRRPGGRRRRRQLGRPGGGLPVPARGPGHPHRARARPEREHIAVPHRPARADPERADHARRRGAGTARRRHAGGGGRGGRPDGRTERSAGPRAVRLYRRQALQRLARRPSRPGRPRLRPDRPGHGSSALETSRPGIFAVGDVRSGSAKRVAAAVGEGAMAIRLAFERIRPG